jgi:hypothetical protein
MPISLDCPSCGRKVQVPENLAGHSVQCPDCLHNFTAPSSPVEGIEAGSAGATVPERLEPCPGCGALIADDADQCRYCGAHLEYDDEERPWEGPGTAVRRDCEPHRGGLILSLGIASIVAPPLGICCSFLGVIFTGLGLGLGISAWVMGSRDLKKINSKIMDPEGLSTTQAGWICGIIGTILSALGTVAAILLFGFLGVMMYTASKAGPPAVPAPPAAAPAPNPNPPGPAQPPPAQPPPAPALEKEKQTAAPASFRIQRRAQVALAQVGQHDHNQLAGRVRPPGDLQGGPDRRARADAAQDSLLAGHAPRHLEGVLVLDLDHLIHDVQVQNARDKPGADALYLVLARL